MGLGHHCSQVVSSDEGISETIKALPQRLLFRLGFQLPAEIPANTLRAPVFSRGITL